MQDTALLDGGALRILDGRWPTSSEVAPPGWCIVLAELDFPTPAFGSARDGVAEAHDLSRFARANGAPTWFRAVSADGHAVFDGSVGLESSRADLELSVATIAAGAQIVLTSLTYTLPRDAS